MEVFLNKYGLIAVKSIDGMTIEDIGRKLKIDLEVDDIVTLQKASQAEENRIGLYNDNLFLCVDNIFDFFNKQLDESVIKLLTSFNKGKICAVFYYSIPDLFGYSYFENGERIRTKYGEMNDVWVDIGDILPIEKESESNIDIANWIVEQVTGDKLTILIGKKIDMTRFR
jgi:hypothetical protein